MNRFIRVWYDPSFARPNTWILHPTGIGVRLRCDLHREGVKREHVMDVPVRYLRTQWASSPERVFFRPLDDDGSRWTSQEYIFGPPVGCAEITLERCPRIVDKVLREL